MNYICQNHRTVDVLRTWSGTKELLILTFFFWNAGAALEKSSEGLLRSLLYQILERFPGLIPLSYDSPSSIEHESGDSKGFRPIAAWTERRLHTTLQSVMLQVQEVCRICIFIDGLDENSDDQDKSIAHVEDMVSADAKICISSRPDRSFSDAFDSGTRLRLQDLTETDILTYLRDQLQHALQKRSADEDEVSEILDSIADKAQRVFLWVRLVVKTLINGLRNHDSLDQLRTRVESTPSDIEAMYAKMLSNIDVAYRKEAALLFRMALNFLTKSLLDTTSVLCSEIHHVSIASSQDAVLCSRQTLERIPTVGAGLLEVILDDKDSAKSYGRGWRFYANYDPFVTLPLSYACSSETADLSFYERSVHIDFIHRTAKDFLCQSKQAECFLEEFSASCSGFRPIYVKGLLAKVDLLGFPQKPANIDDDDELNGPASFSSRFHAEDPFDDYVDDIAGRFVDHIMNQVSQEELMTDTPQVSLCEDVDRTLATVYQRQRMHSPLSHWVTRWYSFDFWSDYRAPVAQCSRKSSRSRSRGSFHSARSESTLSTNEPVDFLGLAASCGLLRYVREEFDAQSSCVDNGYRDYLLYCPLRRFASAQLRFGDTVMEASKLIDDFLSYGGNPNVHVPGFSTTIWGLFLKYVRELGHNLGQEVFATTAKAFIEAGADVHIKIRGPSHRPHGLRGLAWFYVDRRQRLLVHSEDSAFSIVRCLLAQASVWKTVEEMILAKGGYESRQCIDVEGCNSEPCNLSDRQKAKVIAALNTTSNNCASQCYEHDDWQSNGTIIPIRIWLFLETLTASFLRMKIPLLMLMQRTNFTSPWTL